MPSDDNAHMNDYRGRLELEIENLKEQCRWKIFPHEKPKNHEYVLVADKDKLNYALAQYVHMSFHVCPGTVNLKRRWYGVISTFPAVYWRSINPPED